MVLESELIKDWYTFKEVAELAKVTSRTILNYERRGLVVTRLDEVSNRKYVSREEVKKLLAAKGVLVFDK